MTAVSILTDQNVRMTPEVVMLLAPAPAHSGQKKIIIEIVGEPVYTVLDEKHGMFRISIRFRHFKGEGRKLLASILSKIPRPKPQPAHYGLV